MRAGDGNNEALKQSRERWPGGGGHLLSRTPTEIAKSTYATWS